MTCPLCHTGDSVEYHVDRRRCYLQCPRCHLVYVPARYHLDPHAEKAEYDKHQNTPDDPGYRRFLGRLAEPLGERMAAGSRGLDFGCGPGPALADILEGKGLRVALYDRYYFPDASTLCGSFDFICATEVVEHLAHPDKEISRLWQALAGGGVLAIMTKLVINPDRFANWHYIRDPTHIAFYSRSTLQWLARRLGARLEFVGDDVIFLTKDKAGRFDG